MITIVYNHKEKSMWNKYVSQNKGLLGFDKLDKTFSCEDSDLQCAGVRDGVNDLQHKFILELEQNGHTRIFTYIDLKRDKEGEINYWIWKTNDGFTFMVFND